MNEGWLWGGGADLSPWETVMWRIEGDPHTSSTSMLVELLDRAPDWERLVHAHVRGSLQVPRLREKIVEPAVPVGLPAWSPDSLFDIDHHVYRLRLPKPATMAVLHEAIADVLQRPLDRARPPWEGILITGLKGGRAAYMLKHHHALADGMAIVQLLEILHSHTSAPGPRQVPQQPTRPSVTPYTLAAKRMVENATAPMALARRMPQLLRDLPVNPVRAATEAAGYAASLRRQISPPMIERSPLLRGRGGTGCSILTFDMPLASLRAAGKAAGGSINSAFLAAVAGGIRRYHEQHHAAPVDVPIAVPVSTRTAADAPGGNRFTAVRLVAPVAEVDPAARIQRLHAQVREARDEPALAWLETASMVIDKLPTAALIDLVFRNASTADMQLSNFAGVRWEAYVAGAKVTGIYPIGARPGVAMMGTMLSYEGTACVGLHLDPDVFPDVDTLERCLKEGFEEVFALAEEGDSGDADEGGASKGTR